MKLVTNLIIVVLGVFITLFIFSNISKKETSPVPTPEPTENIEAELISLKGVHIFFDSPKPEGLVTDPMVISGRAPGNWFFEANAPVTLTDWDGLIIAEGYVTALGNWMTTDYVPFTGTLYFTKPGYGTTGSFIFKKDNPSDEPQFDDAVEMRIRFE